LLVALFITFSVLFARFGGGYHQMVKASGEERRRTSLRALPSVGLAAFIILGIYAGAFTPTEAAGVGLAGALMITGAFLRTLTWTRLKKAVSDSMVTTASILIIVAGAKVFGKALALYRIPQDISGLIASNIHEAGLFLLVVSVLLLVMGLFLEALSMLLIMVPLLSPSLPPLGIDPIWFGVFFVIMIECALITPPVGLNLYVIQSVGQAKLGEVAGGVWPFLLLMLVTMLGIYLMPDIVLFIPYGS
jgi:C4-dicarboxylate transporter DctM subunit